jgi:hypothetical protein
MIMAAILFGPLALTWVVMLARLWANSGQHSTSTSSCCCCSHPCPETMCAEVCFFRESVSPHLMAIQRQPFTFGWPVAWCPEITAPMCHACLRTHACCVESSTYTFNAASIHAATPCRAVAPVTSSITDLAARLAVTATFSVPPIAITSEVRA